MANLTLCKKGRSSEHAQMAVSVKILGDVWAPYRMGEDELADCFARLGSNFFAALDGEFAILVSVSEDEFYLVRDPVGLHPLYFKDANPREYSAFLADLVIGPKVLDGSAVRSCLRADYRPAEGHYSAPVKGISTLAPGTYLHFRAGSIEVKRYWTPWRISPEQTPIGESFFGLLTAAVDKRIFGFKKPGISFSGGLDSSALAAVVKTARSDLALISYRFRKYPLADEENYQHLVSQHLGCDNPWFYAEDLVDHSAQIPQQVDCAEMPLVDPMFALFKGVLDEAKKFGRDVVLTGHWGDQVLGPMEAVWECFANGQWSAGRSLIHALKASFPAEQWMIHRRNIGRALLHGIKRPWLSLRQDYFRSLLTSRYHVNCMEWNFKIGRRLGMRVYAPFLDKSVIEFMLRAQVDQLFKSGQKGVLRDSLAGKLPAQLLVRKDKADFSQVVRAFGGIEEDKPLWQQSDAQAMAYWGDSQRLEQL